MKRFMKTLYKFFVVAFSIVLLSNLCHAQSFTYADTHPVNNIDSLKTWLNKNPKPTVQRLKALIQYQRTIYYINIRMEKTYFDEIEKISIKLKNRTGLASCNLLKTYNSVFEENLSGTIKLLGELRLEFEELNDPSGQFHTYLTLYSIYIKLNSNNEYKTLQHIYLEKVQELLNKNPNVYDQSNLYLVLLFSALSQKQNEQILSCVVQLKNLHKNNQCLAYLGNITKLAENMILTTIPETEIDNRIRIIENQKSTSRLIYAQNSYLLNMFGEYYYKHKSFVKASAAFKKSIEYSKKSPLINYEVLIQAFQMCRNIEQKEFKNFEVANMLSDSILKYSDLLSFQRNNFELSSFQMQYGLKKAQLESEIFTKNIKLSEKQKDDLERRLELQKQQALNEILNNKLKINQKELELTKASLEKAELEESAIKIKNENLYLYSVLSLLAILLLMFAYFYKKRLNSNKELNQLINDREKIMAIIAHDLRSPIANLMASSTSIKFLLSNNRKEDLQMMLNSIEKQANNTLLLINNLSEWGQMKSFANNKNYQTVDVGELIQNIIEQYKPIVEAKKIDLSLVIAEQTMVNTNIKYLSIILRNIIDNAQKNTSNGGKIIITLMNNRNNHNFTISIKDTGKGFSEETLAFIRKVFDKKMTPKIGTEGLGLGIILISSFAEKINGLVSVESKIDEGTTFSLLLPNE